MRTAILSFCLLFVASAAVAAPRGTGNFRRTDAIKATRGNVDKAFVRGLGTMAPSKNPKASRILFVEDTSTHKVSVVKAPINKGQKVQVLTAKQIKNLGLLTQSQARALASYNAGVYGTKGKVSLKALGITSDGVSYQFKQTGPLGWKIPLYKSNDRQVYGKVISVYRTVPVTGQQGESASGYAQTIQN
jgi:hypothetical protein